MKAVASLVACATLVACGGGAEDGAVLDTGRLDTAQPIDSGLVDPGPSLDLPADTVYPRLDLPDLGTDAPVEGDPGAEVSDPGPVESDPGAEEVSDPGPVEGDPGAEISDPGPVEGDPGPDAPTGCQEDADCEGQVPLGACEVPKCVNLQCVAAAAPNNTSCDDLSPCTVDDACDAGVCSGVQVVCDDPEPDVCENAATLKAWQIKGACNPETGICEYVFDLVPCAGGCASGGCIGALELLQSDWTAAGLLGLSDGTFGLSCVMPGWTGGQTMSSGQWVLDAGFEP